MVICITFVHLCMRVCVRAWAKIMQEKKHIMDILHNIYLFYI